MYHDAYRPTLVPLARRHGVRVKDPVENAQFTLHADTDLCVEPSDRDADRWCFPVDVAARVDTDELYAPLRLGTYVRRPDGRTVESTASDESSVVDSTGPLVVELTSTPVKLFVHGHGPVEIRAGDHRTTLRFSGSDSVHVAARSLHEQPARTLTAPRDMESLMRVVSELGGALKTTTCERSFPTLRGHPPLVEFGETVDIPGGELRPDTGVRLELPPEPEYVFPATPLAYYLGAEVVPGGTPRLITTAGVEHTFPLSGFDEAAARLLRHVFTLDCLTRPEGFYPVELAERRRAAERGLDFDWAAAYDQPLAEQLGTYLSVPFEAVEPLVPEWRLTADIVPDIDRAAVLPHLANELASVRIFDRAGTPRSESSPAELSGPAVSDAIEEFSRVGPSAGFTRGGTPSTRTRADHSGGGTSGDGVLRVPDAETTTQTYIGDGFPINANKASQESYERQLRLRADTPDHISVTVVCNDDEMVEELEVGDYYGTRDLLEFDVQLRSGLSRDRLREVLADDTDFVHYIGHVEEDGLQATDGYLDAHTLDEVGATAFILNGCSSFRQGQALVDAGAIAGIVTLEDIHNSLATEIGTNLARLVNRGFPLDAAVEVVQDDALVGRHYMVVGDGSIEVATAEAGTPKVVEIDTRVYDDMFDVEIRSFATQSYHLGSMSCPFIQKNDVYYLASGNTGEFEVDLEQLNRYLSLETVPLQVSSERNKTTITLRWSDNTDITTLQDSS